jgi:hypothetical protein
LQLAKIKKVRIKKMKSFVIKWHTTFRALRSAGRIYSSCPEQKLNKDIELITYSVDELRWVESDMQLTGVTEADARPRQPR